MLGCPKCKTKNINFFIRSDRKNGKSATWRGECLTCGYKIDYSGTKSDAIANWNRIIKDIHILFYLDERMSFDFDGSAEYLDFIEKTGFTDHQLKLAFTRLYKARFVNKTERVAYYIDTMPKGKKYLSCSINPHGTQQLKRLLRGVLIKIPRLFD